MALWRTKQMPLVPRLRLGSLPAKRTSSSTSRCLLVGALVRAMPSTPSPQRTSRMANESSNEELVESWLLSGGPVELDFLRQPPEVGAFSLEALVARTFTFLLTEKIDSSVAEAAAVFVCTARARGSSGGEGSAALRGIETALSPSPRVGAAVKSSAPASYQPSHSQPQFGPVCLGSAEAAPPATRGLASHRQE